jgi:hypothetical protein
LTIKTYTRAVRIGGLVVSLVARGAVVVVAVIGLPITTTSTSTITSSAASTTRGLLPKVKVIGTYKTLSSWAYRAYSITTYTYRAAAY